MKATYEDMYNDTKMIREKRAKMKEMHKGIQAVTFEYIQASGNLLTMSCTFPLAVTISG